MESKQIGTIIFGAAAAWAVYSFLQMPKEERQDLIRQLKTKTTDLLEDADNTVEKVQHYVSQINNTHSNEWFDKLYLLRRMLKEFYGSMNKNKQIALNPSVRTGFN